MLPTDLEAYFRHMLNNVDSTYRVEAAKCFDIVLQSKRALSLLTYSFLDEDDPVRLVLASHIKPLTAIDLRSRCRAMSKRLNARCQDLLEITTATQTSIPSTALEALLQSSGRRTNIPRSTKSNFPTPDDFQLYRVDFLHRTVRDFLEADEMRGMFSSRLLAIFDSLRWLCASFLQQVKCLPPGLSLASIRPLFVTLVENATCFARESEFCGQNSSPQTDLLDELERVIAVLYSKFGANLLNSFMEPDTFGPIRHLTEAVGGSFTAICVRRDLFL
ncbi:hypothetical protein BO94DRAFT_135031 [Aspergillus sclerotioniger CBS 115572]|uniref:DUF7791 domain-containing protein n=1 Tax=Aspergillus sclerotioniger CBS 115572 TaxID=1450535 RepID=A0A317XFB0_9EURO|nr:hypothetical protein BO94DRAFT_135031 [Aspergillus sclerotioniger CBS 115572]PWY95728.1 hypothetical protein BO94DRAFT_135031 [Aspergillus sclerotioniger CBS 115572]